MKKRRNTCCSSFEIPPYIYIFPENLFQLNFIREKGKKKSHRFLSFILPKFRDSNSEKTELFRFSSHHLSVEFALPRDSSSRIILFSRRSWNILSSPFEEKKEKSFSRARKVTLAKLLDFSSRIKKKKGKERKGNSYLEDATNGECKSLTGNLLK